MPHKKPTTLTGAAGEYTIVAELLKRGFIASLMPDGVPNIDVLVTDVGGAQIAALQVKTRWDIGSDGGWHMSAKHEKIVSERLFYAFVDFHSRPEDQATIFIIPSQIVAGILKRDHQAWVNAIGPSGKPRKDSNMRRMRPDFSNILPHEKEFSLGWMNQYKEAWELLELKTIE